MKLTPKMIARMDPITKETPEGKFIIGFRRKPGSRKTGEIWLKQPIEIKPQGARTSCPPPTPQPEAAE